ncbi:MAG: PhoU family transcriptional regulator [Phycisphaerae bacterium]|nr:PhoU family transcriptional regulator [Phycisphaerae bacterium]
MWKEIISAFRHTDVVETLEGMIGEMLDAGRWMFQQVSDLLERKIQADDLRAPLYEKDRRINQLEQQIREKIVTHLSVGNPQDLGPCLVLMSVVKDAERIGDYCKNIFEVGKFYQGEFNRPEFQNQLEEISSTIRGMFDLVKQAMLENDTSLAKEVIAKKEGVSKSCNMLVQQLLSLTGTDIPAGEAVAYALLARYYKRAESHLSNLASSVVSPVPLLDFHGKIE